MRPSCKHLVNAHGQCQWCHKDHQALTIEKLEIELWHQNQAFECIANLAHLAWTDPPSIKAIFEKIETIAKEKTAQ